MIIRILLNILYNNFSFTNIVYYFFSSNYFIRIFIVNACSCSLKPISLQWYSFRIFVYSTIWRPDAHPVHNSPPLSESRKRGGPCYRILFESVNEISQWIIVPRNRRVIDSWAVRAFFQPSSEKNLDRASNEFKNYISSHWSHFFLRILELSCSSSKLKIETGFCFFASWKDFYGTVKLTPFVLVEGLEFFSMPLHWAAEKSREKVDIFIYEQLTVQVVSNFQKV